MLHFSLSPSSFFLFVTSQGAFHFFRHLSLFLNLCLKLFAIFAKHSSTFAILSCPLVQSMP